MLFDSHAHLNDDKLINRVDDIIENAKKNKVEKIICVGYDYDSSLLAVELANQYDEIYATIGIHPSEVNHHEISLDWMEELLTTNAKVVGIGEIGLDYYWDKNFMEQQKTLFIKQIELANKHHKPIVVHMRDSTQDTYEVLKQYKNPDTLGVMHCYSSSREAMRQFIDLNMFISLAGPVTFKNARVSKEVAESVPLEWLLVETDSPYLAPVPYRGKLNEPKNVVYIAKTIADIKQISLEDLERITYSNTCRLFQIEEEVK